MSDTGRTGKQRAQRRLSQSRGKDKTKRVVAVKKPVVARSARQTVDARVDFPIVGIGASAGGLEAFKKFLRTMPVDSGLAFVLVQHLDPTHESLTAELLAKCTAMKVVQVEDRMPVEADHVYVIPPNKYLAINDDGALHLTAPIERRGLRTPIDFFLRSLADVRREDAIGIILSGTGSDGTLGLTAIKGRGGMAMAQAPDTAPYDGMPRSAIGTGLIDYVLPIEGMPTVLIKYVQSTSNNKLFKAAPTGADTSDGIDAVLAVLRTHRQHDFRCYKKGTLMRRIGRRMNLHHIERIADYERMLHENPTEATQLSRDLLIGVTGFFREAAAFKILEEQVIPKLVREAAADEPLRVWVPACATGEEPYSIAILLVEQLEAANKSNEVQVFATDIDDNALASARAGIYPENIAADVGPRRLERFFHHEGQTFKIGERLRHCVVFAVQNLIGDPPFSALHLVSCRNLLIYLEPEIQTKVIPLFHFALKSGGHLFLGNTETIGRHSDLFEPVTRKWRIYRRIGPTRADKVEFPIGARSVKHGIAGAPLLPRPVNLSGLVQEHLLAEYAPAAVLINRQHEILFFHGATERFLKQPTGNPTRDLLDLAANGLRTKLRTAVKRAVDEDQRVTESNVRFRRKETYCTARVTVLPIESPATAAGMLLVAFEDEPQTAPIDAANLGAGRSDDAQVHQLEFELKSTREELQSTIEELESANEELKASNEEMMSMNEELQSTNEELETSKEELQSTNEELTTVNSQLQEKFEELGATNDDLINLFRSTSIATIFLDSDLRIKRFTPEAAELFSVIPADLGRPIKDISHKFIDKVELLKHAPDVLRGLTPSENERRTEDGSWFIERILPYRTQADRIAGVVVTYTNVTELKRAHERSQVARNYAESIVETVRESLIILNADLRVVSANRAFYRTFRTSAAQLEGHLFFDLGNHQWDIPALQTLLHELTSNNAEFENYEISDTFPDIGHRTLLLNGRHVKHDDTPLNLILIAIEDITERNQAVDELRAEKDRAEVTLRSIGDGVITVDSDGIVEYMNPVAEELTGYPLSKARDRQLERVFHIVDEQSRLKVSDLMAPIFSGREEMTGSSQQAVLVGRNGKDRSIQYSAAAIRGRRGSPQGAVLVFSDVTEARRIALEITHQASHDTMTGLVNRTAFEHRLNQLLGSATEERAEHALCYLDLDQFKVINDTCGHIAGDQLLRELGGVLQSHVRKHDTLARLGGDEFGVLMEHCSLAQATRVADGLREAIEKFQFQWEGATFAVGVSIGLVAITEVSGGITAVLSAADAACYIAKDEGRNRVHVYHATDADQARRHGEMQWVTQITRAFEEDRFRLGCQRIAETNSVNGAGNYYEILVDMVNADGRVTPPGAFLPAAERYNLATKIDRWVVEATIKWFTKHPAILKRVHFYSINLSGQSLGDEQFLTFLVDQISTAGTSPEKICFEVTETATIANLPKAVHFMTTIKELGCRFALDDFGSGLSSFQYLRILPVDFLKIDGVFVKDIVSDPVQLALVRSINELGHVMGKQTIAEFVENDAILKKVREIGVDFVQGFEVGKPEPLENLA